MVGILWIGLLLTLTAIQNSERSPTATEIIESKRRTLCQSLQEIDDNFGVINSRTDEVCENAEDTK